MSATGIELWQVVYVVTADSWQLASSELSIAGILEADNTVVASSEYAAVVCRGIAGVFLADNGSQLSAETTKAQPIGCIYLVAADG